MHTTIFTLAGNKSRLAKKINKYIPSQYSQYVELFGGTLSMLIEQDKLNDKLKYGIIVNDFNKNYYKLYKIIKSDKGIKDLIKTLDKWYYYLKSHKWSKSSMVKLYKDFKNIKNNKNYYLLPLLTRMIYFGLYMVTTENIVWRTNYSLSLNTYNKIKETLYNLHYKLKINNAKIYNNDLTTNFNNILSNIKKSAFVFIDPPYIDVSSTNNLIYGQGKKIKIYSWLKLLIKLENKKAKFMLTDKYTSNSFKEYKKLKPYLHTLVIKKIKGTKYDEIVVMNY